MHSAIIAALAAQSGALSLHSIIIGIPHDAAAFMVYALSGGAIYWVFRAGLKKPDNLPPEDK